MAWNWQVYSDQAEYTLAEAWDGGDEPVCVLRIPVGCVIDLRDPNVQAALEHAYDRGSEDGHVSGRQRLQHEIRTAFAKLIDGRP